MSTDKIRIENILTFGQRYNETTIAGIKMILTNPEENERDGFYFEDCDLIELPVLGEVYLFGEYGFICDGYQWLKFKYSDYLIMAN